MAIVWNYTGAVTSTSARASAKLEYDYGNTVNTPKVFTLTYNGSIMNLYVDNQLVQSDNNIEAGMTSYSTLFFGADYDGVCWFKGLMPEIRFYDNPLSNQDRIDLVNYLKYKWGTGELASDPTITSAIPFLIFNEEGLQYDVNDRVTSWVDNVHGREATLVESGTFGVQEVNNKNALYFDDRNFFELLPMSGSAHNPDYLTLVFVAKFESYDESPYPDGDGGQSLITSTGNAQIRIKKYDADDYLSYRIRDWDGRSYYVDAPKAAILGNTMTPQVLGTLGLTVNGIRQYADVTNDTDFGVAKFDITGLTADTEYTGVWDINGVTQSETQFKFKTLPSGAKSFKIVAGSCNRTGSDASTWDMILAENPDLFIHLGDFNYLDLNAHDKQEYARGTDLSFSPKIKNVFRNMGVVYQYDNHDSLKPTPDKTDATWVPFVEFFTKVHPIHTPASLSPELDGVYYSFMMGRVKCIVTDCRRMRDPQRDNSDPENKSILGSVQKAWFKAELLDAKINPNIEAVLWFSQVLWTGDRDNPISDSFDRWGPSWASYEHERNEIANFLYDNQIKNVTIVCADVHMQAIDDGRNSCYITDVNGDPVDVNTIDKAYWLPMLEASPFDQYLDYEGGPFNVNNNEGSGGPIGSSEQSYGVIEVLDNGEKWLQVKLYTMAFLDGSWQRNRYYTFNLIADNGFDGTPPPLDWNDTTQPNVNGYVSKDDTWKPIAKRYIRKDNEFKEEKFKWKFHKGSWQKIYDTESVNPAEPLIIYQLNGWTVENETGIEIKGKGFIDVSYPTNYGAYYPLGSNTGDLFGNFPYGAETGTVVYGTVEDIRCVTTSPGNYITLPHGLNTGLFMNSWYDKDFVLGFWIYNDGIVTGNQAIITESTSTYGFFKNGNTLNINIGPDAIASKTLNAGWNKVVLLVKYSDTGRYSYLYLNDTKEELLDFVVRDFGDPVSNPVPIIIGYNSTVTLANYYYAPRYILESQIQRYLDKPPTIVVLSNDDTRFEILAAWHTNTSNTKLAFTVPPETPSGEYELTVQNANISSNSLPVTIVNPTARETPFSTNFETSSEVSENFYIIHRAWGGANGGVVKENVQHANNRLTLYANGDLYSGRIQGVTRDGYPKFHTHVDDPQLGKPWTNRVGACLIFKEKTGFGSYRMRCTIPTQLGVAVAFWTFFYNEIYPGDPRWNDFLAEGLHPQGNMVDGFYMTRNHEIDIEFPSHLEGEILWQPSFNNMKCNVWRGELKNWDVSPDDPAYWTEYTDHLTPTGMIIENESEHEFRFDWYKDRVEYYIDGVLKHTNSDANVPDIAGHYTFGLWFPSAPRPDKPWLARQNAAWAGGTLDSDGGVKAMFDRVKMEIKNFSFIPFDQTGLRKQGETYPFGGYRLYE